MGRKADVDDLFFIHECGFLVFVGWLSESCGCGFKSTFVHIFGRWGVWGGWWRRFFETGLTGFL